MNSTPICYPNGFTPVLNRKQVWGKARLSLPPLLFGERKRELEIECEKFPQISGHHRDSDFSLLISCS